MRTQEQIQYDITRFVEELSERKPSDPNITFGEAMKDFPDLKSKWDVLLKEVDEIKAKGMWKSPPKS